MRRLVFHVFAVTLLCDGMRILEDTSDELLEAVRSRSNPARRMPGVVAATLGLLHAVSVPAGAVRSQAEALVWLNGSEDDTELRDVGAALLQEPQEPQEQQLPQQLPQQQPQHQQSQGRQQGSASMPEHHAPRHVAEALDFPKSFVEARHLMRDVKNISLWATLTAPDALIAIGFAVLVTLFFLTTFFSDVVTAKKREEVRQQHNALYSTYGIEAGKLIEHLDAMSADATSLAERNFQEKQRTFQKSLNDILKDQNPVLSEPRASVSGLYRRWFLSWLHTFGQCSLDPVNGPKHICTELELKNAGNVKAMAGLMLQRLKDAPVHFITEDLKVAHEMFEGPGLKKAGRRKGFRASECCCMSCCCSWVTCGIGFGITVRSEPEDPEPFPVDVGMVCIKVTLLSWTHVRMFGTLFVAIGLTTFYGVVQQFFLAGVTGYSMLLILILLCYVDGMDESQRLQKEVKQLEEKGAEIEKHRADINTSFKKMQNLLVLWRFQTVPRLENFSELDSLIKDVPEVRRYELLEGLVARMENLDTGMGDMSLWVGKTALEENKLKLFAQQMDTCTNDISKKHTDANPLTSVFRRLDTLCGFLTVRVIACYDLPNKDAGIFFGTVDAYVVVLAEECKTGGFRTRNVENNLNPRWSPKKGPYSEEFFMPVSADAKNFNLQVWGDNGTDDPTRFGFLMTKFRDKPGGWQRKREKLYNMRTRKLRDHGEIEYEFFYANSVQQLANMLRK